ncbi:ATP-binding protein [Micromonospora sp. WMMD1082]|uniref:ATP-binding protein n=1 Tax=Micromonospora sp. WMMD1082 TaxID=3016104 RepID=UPI002417CAEA|nr:ATP-binding protein [Micromonospora sp. WMMD1082]MDG4797477.1 ATP-binding protein [Micromonospora sp. WMMD1082]
MNNLGPPDARDPSGPSSGDGEVISLLSQSFTAQTVTALRHLLADRIAAAGLTGDIAEDLVLAVHELVTNAVLHGGGRGRLDLFRQADLLVCEVTDHGRQPGADGHQQGVDGHQQGAGLPVSLPATDTPGGRGLWLAHHLTGALTLTRRPDGMTATVTAALLTQPAGTPEPAGAPEPAGPPEPPGFTADRPPHR